jgi:hypothetical protein
LYTVHKALNSNCKACYGKNVTTIDIIVKQSVGNKGAVPLKSVEEYETGRKSRRER